MGGATGTPCRRQHAHAAALALALMCQIVLLAGGALSQGRIGIQSGHASDSDVELLQQKADLLRAQLAAYEQRLQAHAGPLGSSSGSSMMADAQAGKGNGASGGLAAAGSAQSVPAVPAPSSQLPLPVIETHLELAMTLQQLNHLKPDGGRRVPEAVRSYRCEPVWEVHTSWGVEWSQWATFC